MIFLFAQILAVIIVIVAIAALLIDRALTRRRLAALEMIRNRSRDRQRSLRKVETFISQMDDVLDDMDDIIKEEPCRTTAAPTPSEQTTVPHNTPAHHMSEPSTAQKSSPPG